MATLVRPLVDESIQTDGYSCDLFTGLRVTVDGVTTYIRHPYSVSKNNGVVTLVSSFGETVSFRNSEYPKAWIDEISFGIEGTDIVIPKVYQYLTPVDSSNEDGVTSFSYTEPLDDATYPPILAPVVGSDDVSFWAMILSWDANGCIIRTIDESGNLYNGDGQVLIVTH